MATIDFLDEIRWRGLLHQCTNEDALRAHLGSGRRRAYAGFDPTADSLTIGNLVPMMVLAHFKRAGHEPVVLMGGGTGLIGDPSGKSAERQLMSAETVAGHVACQRPIFESVLGGDVVVRDNAEWLTSLSYIDALRDVGKHFSVNMMMAKESVRARLEDREHGISYTEFSYMILQAYDFAHLHRADGVTVQLGGSDQYGNIVAGADLIRRLAASADGGAGADARPAFGLTTPLVTKADGGKFGKTESGAIWLTAARTSPYAYYQFWLNATDADVIPWLRIFTFLTRDEIADLEGAHRESPGARAAQRELARAATTILHGADEASRAEAAGKALFSGDVADLDERTMREVFAEVPSSDHPRSALASGADPVALLKDTGLASSNREARSFLAGGSVTVNGRRLGAGDDISENDLLHGSMIAIRRGKKTWHLTRWT